MEVTGEEEDEEEVCVGGDNGHCLGCYHADKVTKDRR